MTNIIDKVAELNAELSDFIQELTEDNLISNKRRLSNTLSYLIENLIELSNELDNLEWIYFGRGSKNLYLSDRKAIESSNPLWFITSIVIYLEQEDISAQLVII